MDKNQAIGLLLSGLLLIIYFQFFAPKSKPAEVAQSTENVQNQPSATDSSAAIKGNNQTAQDSLQIDSLVRAADQEKYGVFAAATRGTAQDVMVNNKNVVLTFNTRGGIIERVELKDYKTYDGKPLIMLDKKSSSLDLLVPTANGNVNLHNLYYTPSANNVTVNEGDTTEITFTAELGGGSRLQQIYSIPGEGYKIGYEMQVSNPEGVIKSNQLTLVWHDALKDLEKDIQESRRRSTLNYYTAEGDLDKLVAHGENEEKSEVVKEKLGWINMKQRFFSSALIAAMPFQGASLKVASPEDSSSIVHTVNMEVNVPVTNGKAGFSYYFGPNDLQIMRGVAPDFEDNIDFGWPIVRLISRYVIAPLFHFLQKFIGSYGIIIIVLVLVIKTFLFPLSYKSYISMAKTKVLKPELDEIKAKYGDDAQKAQKEQMQLYSKVGVNPLSGCVPTLLQMPILLAMFNFFPSSIELRQQSFLWATDLSTYDSILTLPFKIPAYGDHVSLFVLLMTASTILYTWSNNQVTTVQGPMKSMQYLMPVVFMFVLNSYPAALSFYYFVSNLVTFGQQAIIRKFVDDDKIRKILDENKKRNKNKKKSKFQQRLEDAMKATEESKKNKK